MHDFPVRLPLRIDWSDMDLFGHVNNVAYFRYVQASRVHYWELSGLAASFAETRIGPILLSTSCQFIRPLFYPGDIVTEARIEFMKNTSFGIHHRIIDHKGEVAAEAHDVIVMFDFKANSKVLIPKQFSDAVALLEKP